MKQASGKPMHLLALAALAMLLFGTGARAADKLLDEVVGFTGEVLLLQTRVPALVIGVVRDGKTTVLGFGETSDGSGKPPDGQTMLRVGSLTKAFTGQVLASLAADGTVKFTDRLQDRIGWDVTIPTRNGHQIRLIDLVTHSSGLPRELERRPGPADDPFATLTPDAYRQGLASDPLVFAPGTGALYSNFGFDVLSAALSHAAAKPYDALLKERILDPAGLKDTVLLLRPGDEARLLQGHNFDGKPMPNVGAPLIAAGASALYSTPDDILHWLSWHLDRFGQRMRRSAFSIMPPICSATASIPSRNSTNPVIWMPSAWVGSSWRRRVTGRLSCRRQAVYKASSATRLLPRRAASAFLSPSTNSTSAQRRR